MTVHDCIWKEQYLKGVFCKFGVLFVPSNIFDNVLRSAASVAVHAGNISDLFNSHRNLPFPAGEYEGSI